MESLVATADMAYYCFEVLEHELETMKNGKKRKASLPVPDPFAYGIPDYIEWCISPYALFSHHLVNDSSTFLFSVADLRTAPCSWGGRRRAKTAERSCAAARAPKALCPCTKAFASTLF
jgi:hypothetical protein